MSVNVTRSEPFGNFNFRVSIISPKLGNIKCGFQSVTGLGLTINYKEYREGGNNGVPDKIVESISDSPVQFTAGLSENESIMYLTSYYLKPSNGLVGAFENRFEIIIEVMDKQAKKAVKTYHLKECVLETFNLGELNSMGAEIAVESFSVRYNALSVN